MATSQADARRLSPFHHKEASLGAQFTVDDFGWARAEKYTDPASEKKAVEEGVGIADLSYLTKLGLNGLGLRQLISERYNPPTSGVRGRVLTGGRGLYGTTWCAMFNFDEGMLVCNEPLKEKIIKELAGSKTGHFTIVDVSSVFAACCLSGPNGTGLLRRLTELNVNPEDFPNLSVTHTPIRHVPTILLRNDFGPTRAYQLYFERAYAEYVWDAVFSSGQGLGCAPVGTLTMKLLGLN